ncbi:SHOCT domain-containing protein [Agrobacterium sp. CCNWLW32]|uniref:SHOCT domain-containing protein n=1 Tax=Agrobacterium sp. CCNWLW32 TaxID=3122072 RepID=UPI00301046CD
MRGIFNIIFFLFLATVLTMSLVGTPLLILYLMFVFIGGKKRREKVQAKVINMLMSGEEVVGYVIENRVMSLFQRRLAIFVTNSRIIFVQRKILGGYQMMDRQWKDLQDAKMDENIMPNLFGASLSFSFINPPGGVMSVSGVDPEAAAKLYTYSQAQEHAWEEKRRVRTLEEKRAASGGINFHGFPQAAQQPQAQAPALVLGQTIDVTPTDTVVAEINRAKALLDSGAIADAEFQEIKSKILSRHFQ